MYCVVLTGAMLEGPEPASLVPYIGQVSHLMLHVVLLCSVCE